MLLNNLVSVMSNHCFSFLEDDFRYISSECEECEKLLVEGYYKASIKSAGKACEFISKEVAKNIGRKDLIYKKQYPRLKALIEEEQAIPEHIGRHFWKIKDVRDKVTHESYKHVEIIHNLHKRLFEVCVWFYRDFLLNDLEVQEYNGPVYVSPKVDGEEIAHEIDKVGQKIDQHQQDVDEQLEKMKRQIEELENKKDEPISESVPNEEDNLSDYPFKTKKRSYLLNELSKLNISSAESVESEGDLTRFKNYIHVDRSIQYEFIEEIQRVVEEDSSHLVMLCGSVGDGKSHLLAYLKTKHPELYNKFTIHGDATESHFTQKNAEDTLAEVLSSFDDENIDSSFEKFILAINLGVLNNFLESDYCNERYTRLKQIIEDANIFDSDIISHNIIQDKVSFITFSDYNLFELTGDYDTNYVSSDYISSLICKITDDDYYNNPFYRAYRMDKESEYNHPIIYNYEMLCDEDVQKVLIEYIIRIFVEYKKIISTRDLLNFIYELIVPSEFIKYDKNDPISDFVDYLLPNMLFNNPYRSSLLNLLSQYDPTLSRSEKLDKFIIKFNISHDLNDILDEYYNTSKLGFLNSYFDEYSNLYECGDSEKNELIVTLIRFALFYGKSNFKSIFHDENYLTYLRYLYAYNIQNHSQYHDLFSQVKEAIFNLKGSVKKGYVCIDELESFKVSKELKLKYYSDSFDVAYEDKLANRFKTSIKVIFSASQGEKKSLEVDFPLYSAICKLNDGYKPNKVEKENLVLFDEFINNLINETSSDDLIVRNIDLNVDFVFEYAEDFNRFTFERGG